MLPKFHRALLVSEKLPNVFSRKIVERKTTDLKENEVFIRVKYSSLNYKDALSMNGHKGVSPTYPHVPGIDAGGIVLKSKSNLWQKGDEVVVIGRGLGMTVDGGFSEIISVPSTWVMGRPKNLPLKETMMYGTAGFTAAYGIWSLLEGLKAKKKLKADLDIDTGKVNFLVTGASGGVGSVACALLNHLGYSFTASTQIGGKGETFLKTLGITNLIDRKQLKASHPKKLLSPLWDGALDTVGGETLSNILKTSKNFATIASCGLVGSALLQTSVYPFLLRGVRLVGINSAECPMSFKTWLLDKLSKEWKLPNLQALQTEISLKQVKDILSQMLKGNTTGRYLLVHQ